MFQIKFDTESMTDLSSSLLQLSQKLTLYSENIMDIINQLPKQVKNREWYDCFDNLAYHRDQIEWLSDSMLDIRYVYERAERSIEKLHDALPCFVYGSKHNFFDYSLAVEPAVCPSRLTFNDLVVEDWLLVEAIKMLSEDL